MNVGARDHRLLVTAHHIAIDGWSLRILVTEFSKLYTAFRSGKVSPLPELALQYADFAVWQRTEVREDTLDDSLAYWRDQLEGAPALLQLPLDHPRPSVRTFRGGAESCDLEKSVGQAIAELGRSEGATVFMTMAAAFQLLLGRLVGEDDVVIGIPVAGRTRVEAESMLGCFINTLPLRTKINAEMSFRELLREVRRSSLEAYAHQGAPFDLVVEKLNPHRDLSHAPIFQVLFNMLNLPAAAGDFQDMCVERSVAAAHAKFDLTMYVDERPQGTHLRLVYSTDLFAAARGAALLQQYVYLLSQIVSDPGAPVQSYSLVPRCHADALPDPGAALSARWEGTVTEMFSSQAARGPHRTAVVDRDMKWTYRELDERSSRLAHHLRSLGAQKGDVVAIYAQRSGSLVLALMGILKAGAAFVVLDRAYPSARLLDCLEACAAKIIVRLEDAGPLPDLLQRFATETQGVSVCDVPAFTQARAELWSRYPASVPRVDIGPDDTAYIAFTSGTTGEPKGIVGRHGSLTHFTPWVAETFALGADDRYSLLSGLAHDPLHRDIFTPLQLGACIYVPNPQALYDPDQLARWMSDVEITVAHLTPALGQLVSSSSLAPSLARLRLAFFVGDTLTRRDVTRLRGIAPDVQVVNYYGTTETQRALSYYIVDCSHARGDTAASAPREIVPLGRGTPDVQLLVISRNGRLAGVGEAGEIYIRSPHIAKGYLNDDRLTSERFVANPVTGDTHDRCYRTGDLGRYDPDGNVVSIGRADTQVKIRGFRVELAEIEAVLGKHASVRESVVTSYVDGGETRLAAYVVLSGEAPAEGELRQFLKSRLPGYMAVSSINWLDVLPLTPNGKVDRRALPAPNIEEVSRAATGSRLRSPAEEELHAIWTEILQVPSIDVDDDFFDLGGHSLLAVRMMERITEIFGTRLPLSVLFEEPTIRQLANSLIANVGLVEADATCVQQGRPGRTPLFLFHGDFTGGGLYCRKLVRYLDADQPVYVIAPGMPGDRETVEEMASDALPHIRRIQAEGPYLIAGYCNGGMVALELARKLRVAGEEVKFLAVIDIGAKNVQLARLYDVTKRVTGALRFSQRRQIDMLVRLNEPALRFLRDELPPVDDSSSSRERLAFARALAGLVVRRTVRRMWRAGLYAARLRGPRAQPSKETPLNEVTSDERLRHARGAHITRALKAYVPRAYDGTITLIVGQEGRVATDGNHLRHWRSVGQVNVVTIPGDHGSVVTSRIDGLGTALRAEMARLS